MLRFYELAPSPNNTKIRMALRFKGIEFEAIPVDPMDRSKIVEVSGQELTPVIVDGKTVLYDSEAILRYLDANYRDAPRLLPADRAGVRVCDQWKQTLDEKVARFWLPVFLTAIRRRNSFDPADRQRFEDGLKWLNDELGDRDSFKGPEMAVCDLRVAEWATYALPGTALIERVGLFRNFKELYAIAEGSLPALERFLEPWNARLG